jgi:hypothetical protein
VLQIVRATLCRHTLAVVRFLLRRAMQFCADIACVADALVSDWFPQLGLAPMESTTDMPDEQLAPPSAEAAGVGLSHEGASGSAVSVENKENDGISNTSTGKANHTKSNGDEDIHVVDVEMQEEPDAAGDKGAHEDGTVEVDQKLLQTALEKGGWTWCGL